MNHIGDNALISLEADISSYADELDAVASVDATNASTVKDLIDKGKRIIKDIEEHRKQAKEPHLEAGRQIDNTYNPLKSRVEDLFKPIHGMLQAWTVAEKKRKEREAEEARKEAERIAAEKSALDEALGVEPDSSAAEANSRAAEAQKTVEAASRVRSASGGRASGLRTYRFAEVTDGQSLVAHFWEHPDVLGAATKLANAAIRAAKGGPVNIPGVVVKEEERLA